MIPILVIEGATASGKSGLAIELAEALKTEIISADSRQVYKFMDIGTAKVSAEQRALIPHHLIDVITPDQVFNAGEFANQAATIIKDLHAKGMIPIICGGTGLYVRSLLDGLCKLPDISGDIRENLKEQLATYGLEAMYAKLKALDREYAQKISANDRQRILRGLEVTLGTGVSISQHWQNQIKISPYKVFRILMDIPRELLYKRINNRLQEMVSMGLIEEIMHLFELGYNQLSPGLNSLAYKEYIPYLQGYNTIEECSTLAAQHHRNYAKRQTTWYRKNIFDLTLMDSQVKISEVVNQIEIALTGDDNANHSKSI